MNDLSNEDHELVDAALTEIAPILLSEKNETGAGLLSGTSGRALTLWYLHQYSPSLVNESHFDTIITTIQARSRTLQKNTSISQGLPGIAWLFELFLQSQDDYDPAFNDGVDRLLTEITSTDDWAGELEYVVGLAGMTTYAARRMRQGRGGELYKNICKLFEKRSSTDDRGRLFWITPTHSIFRMNNDNTKECNLGLAHGIPAIIASMIPAIESLDDNGRSNHLVRKGCEWLIAQEQDVNEFGSHFAYLANRPEISRLGWCYGDLGIALTLIRAGHALNEANFIDKGKEIAISSAKRDFQSSGVRDAGLCHGAAGIFLLFDLINRACPDEQFELAKRYWIGQTLDFYRKNGISGFNPFRAGPDGTGESYPRETGLLAGHSGVALCLLSAAGAPATWVDGILLG